MEIKLLASGYWFARWTPEIWAQWPKGREVQVSDFFHAEWSATPERLKELTTRMLGQSGRVMEG